MQYSQSQRDWLRHLSIEQGQGLKVACLEGIVYWMGYISTDQLEMLATNMRESAHGQYLLEILDDRAGSKRTLLTG
jgi:glucose-1-phosphate thymidylyltransferase